jgi:starvation-inducible DNA-binding protein
VNRPKSRAVLGAETTRSISGAMNAILADVFALYIKTKNFHWHMSGAKVRDYTILLNDQAIQLLAMSDLIAARVRELGGSTIKSVGQIARHQRVLDNDAERVAPLEMFAELYEDNEALSTHLREAHALCSAHRDIATTGLMEIWLEETQQRMGMLPDSGCR